mmetsp:Transcript_76271/g.246986  ORF Transcript_76271/g.246986 Transcript_76271/m.246986 type:complete len:444 (+) Transcript_76271:122-1453(+)
MAMMATDELEKVFQAFAAGPEMDGRAFAKCIRDAGLLDAKLKLREVDLVFAGCKPKGGRKIDFAMYRKALTLIAAKRGEAEADVVEHVRDASGPCYRAAPPRSSPSAGRLNASGTRPGDFEAAADQAPTSRSVVRQKSTSPLRAWHDAEEQVDLSVLSGPERFFYDKSTYTGTHRNGGPSVLGGGVPKTGYSDLSELVDRDHVQDDALHRQKWVQDITTPELVSAEQAAVQHPEEPDETDTALQQRELMEPRTDPEQNREAEVLPMLLGSRTAFEPHDRFGMKDHDTSRDVECPKSFRPGAPVNTPSEVSAVATPVISSRASPLPFEMPVFSPPRPRRAVSADVVLSARPTAASGAEPPRRAAVILCPVMPTSSRSALPSAAFPQVRVGAPRAVVPLMSPLSPMPPASSRSGLVSRVVGQPTRSTAWRVVVPRGALASRPLLL